MLSNHKRGKIYLVLKRKNDDTIKRELIATRVFLMKIQKIQQLIINY